MRTVSCPAPLREVSKDDWADRTIVRCALPFPYRRKPFVPSSAPERVGLVPLDKVFASQKTVTAHGLRQRIRGRPFIYRETDGTFTVGDGHHRITQAWLRGQKRVRARIVEAE